MTSQIVYMLLLDAMLSPAARKRYPAAAVGRPQEVNILLLLTANCCRVRLLICDTKNKKSAAAASAANGSSISLTQRRVRRPLPSLNRFSISGALPLDTF